MGEQVKLSAIEAETLTAWRDCDDGWGFGFSKAAVRCSTPLHQMRRSVRALARKGLLQYERCLFSDDGVMGAGYALTRKGWEILNAG
jgi:hypothetical protein